MLRASVVSVQSKGSDTAVRWNIVRRTQVNPRGSGENCTRCQNQGLDKTLGSVRRQPECGANGIRHREGVTRYKAWSTELGKLSRGCQGRRTRGQPLSARVPMLRTVAEPSVVAQTSRRQGLRPLRTHDRHRSLCPSRRPGHERAALPRRTARVLDHGQRFLASRTALCATPHAGLPQPGSGARPDSCQPAQPDRDLLLHPPAQGPHLPMTSPASPRSRIGCCASRSTTKAWQRHLTGGSREMTWRD